MLALHDQLCNTVLTYTLNTSPCAPAATQDVVIAEPKAGKLRHHDSCTHTIESRDESRHGGGIVEPTNKTTLGTRTQENYHSQHRQLLLKKDESTDRSVEEVVARKFPELVYGRVVDETDGARRILYVLRITEFGWSFQMTRHDTTRHREKSR